jgi:hypothetical protein
MPGRLLVGETGKAMGAYKLTFPGSLASQESMTIAGFRNAFAGRRLRNVEYRNAAQQSTASRSLEAPEMEHFASISEDDELHSNESVSTASSNAISDDDYSLTDRASTRTRNTVSDDDALLMEFASRADDFAAQPMRHSTACCSDLAFRRELRKRTLPVEPAVDERLDSASSFTLGNSSFRLELEKEDRVESLALWEERDHRTRPSSTRNVAASLAAPHSWHAGDTAASPATRASTPSSARRNPPSSPASSPGSASRLPENPESHWVNFISRVIAETRTGSS